MKGVQGMPYLAEAGRALDPARMFGYKQNVPAEILGMLADMCKSPALLWDRT